MGVQRSHAVRRSRSPTDRADARSGARAAGAAVISRAPPSPSSRRRLSGEGMEPVCGDGKRPAAFRSHHPSVRNRHDPCGTEACGGDRLQRAGLRPRLRHRARRRTRVSGYDAPKRRGRRSRAAARRPHRRTARSEVRENRRLPPTSSWASTATSIRLRTTSWPRSHPPWRNPVTWRGSDELGSADPHHREGARSGGGRRATRGSDQGRLHGRGRASPTFAGKSAPSPWFLRHRKLQPARTTTELAG